MSEVPFAPRMGSPQLETSAAGGTALIDTAPKPGGPGSSSSNSNGSAGTPLREGQASGGGGNSNGGSVRGGFEPEGEIAKIPTLNTMQLV